MPAFQFSWKTKEMREHFHFFPSTFSLLLESQLSDPLHRFSENVSFLFFIPFLSIFSTFWEISANLNSNSIMIIFFHFNFKF